MSNYTRPQALKGGTQTERRLVGDVVSKPSEGWKRKRQIRKYVPAGVHNLVCTGHHIKPPSGDREKLVLEFKELDGDATSWRFFNLYRDDSGNPEIPDRCAYEMEVVRLFPTSESLNPDELIGLVFRCEVMEVIKDKNGNVLAKAYRPTRVKKVLGLVE